MIFIDNHFQFINIYDDLKQTLLWQINPVGHIKSVIHKSFLHIPPSQYSSFLQLQNYLTHFPSKQSKPLAQITYVQFLSGRMTQWPDRQTL